MQDHFSGSASLAGIFIGVIDEPLGGPRLPINARGENIVEGTSEQELQKPQRAAETGTTGIIRTGTPTTTILTCNLRPAVKGCAHVGD